MTIDELDRFQNDIGVVLQSNAPLELDSRGLKLKSRRKRLAQLKRYRQIVQDRFFGANQTASSIPASPSNEPEYIADAAGLPQLQGPSGQRRFSDELNALAEAAIPARSIPARYRAALQTYAATGTLTPVLDGLTVRGLARQQLERIIRWPLIYLSILATMCCVGLYFHWVHVLPVITSFRASSEKPRLVVGWDYQTWLPAIFAGFSILMLILVLLLLSGGFFRILMWFGGKRYLDLMSIATAQRIVPQLIDSGLSSNQAVSQSCELCGLNELYHSRFLPDLRSDDSQTWLQGSEYWLLNADLELTKLKFVFPVLMMSVAGGLLALVYAVSIYGPVVAMLQDISVPEI